MQYGIAMLLDMIIGNEMIRMQLIQQIFNAPPSVDEKGHEINMVPTGLQLLLQFTHTVEENLKWYTHL